MIRKRAISCNDNRRNECILVAKAVVSSIETLLGPGKSLKCCLSSGTSITTSNTPKVLESMNVEHPAGFIINNTCQSFQKEFGCGCTTLVCLIGYWAMTMQELSEMGVPAPVIPALLDEAFNEFEKVFENSSISLKTLQDKASSLVDLTSPGLPEKRRSVGVRLPQEFTTKNEERTERKGLAGMSDVCDSYFDDEGNVHKDLSRGTIHSNNSSKIKQKYGFGQFIDDSTKTSTDSGQIEREVNCDNIPYHKPRLNKWFIKNPLKDSFFSENFIKSPVQPDAEQPEPIDEFDACFDGLIEKCETLEVEEAPSKKVTPLKEYKKTKNTCYSFPRSEYPLIQELLENKVLPETEFAAGTGRKTNFANVFLKSRYFIDLSVATKPRVSRAEELKIENFSQGRKRSLGNSSDNYLICDVSDVFENAKIDKKQPECSDDITRRFNCDVLARDSWLDLLGWNLAHGHENEMKFALEILHKLYSNVNWQEFSFSLDSIAVETVVGPPSCNSCIVDGVVLMLSKQNESIVRLGCHDPRRIMLVNGDMACNYKHAGFKTPVEVTRVFERENFSDMSLSERKTWIKKVTSIVQSLNVGVVAARGGVDDDLRDCLQGFNVVVLENLNHRLIEMISKMTKTSVVSYPLDLVIDDLGEPVVMRIWYSGWSSQIKNSTKARGMETNTFVQICLDNENTKETKQLVQTLVLCGPVLDLVCDSEAKFWNCVNRLKNALVDKRVLPGGGEIEQCCIEHLEKIKDTCKVNPKTFRPLCRWTSEDCVLFRPLIYDALKKGLKAFISRVDMNTTEDSMKKTSENCVFDNFVCKIEAWKRAIRVVKLLLCSEYHIVTGM